MTEETIDRNVKYKSQPNKRTRSNFPVLPPPDKMNVYFEKIEVQRLLKQIQCPLKYIHLDLLTFNERRPRS